MRYGLVYECVQVCVSVRACVFYLFIAMLRTLLFLTLHPETVGTIFRTILNPTSTCPHTDSLHCSSMFSSPTSVVLSLTSCPRVSLLLKLHLQFPFLFCVSLLHPDICNDFSQNTQNHSFTLSITHQDICNTFTQSTRTHLAAVVPPNQDPNGFRYQ